MSKRNKCTCTVCVCIRTSLRTYRTCIYVCKMARTHEVYGEWGLVGFVCLCVCVCRCVSVSQCVCVYCSAIGGYSPFHIRFIFLAGRRGGCGGAPPNEALLHTLGKRTSALGRTGRLRDKFSFSFIFHFLFVLRHSFTSV